MTVSRRYAGTADYRALLAFASDATRRALPAKAEWHPGDVAWQLVPVDTTQPYDGIRLWVRGNDIVGVVWTEDAYTRIGARERGDAALIDDMLGATESRVGVGDTVLTAAFDDDEQRVTLLERRGYRRLERGSVHLQRDLRTSIPRYVLPGGFRFLDAKAFSIDQRVALHVDAWSHLEHLGLDATSSFDRTRYLRMAASPVYRTELDIVLVNERGAYVSGATGWSDAPSGVGLTEPVGTAFAARGRGYSRAVNMEAIRRLQAFGMRTAVIQTADFNRAAQATYRSCGYELVARDHWWAKRI
jgi:hypothetical protein